MLGALGQERKLRLRGPRWPVRSRSAAGRGFSSASPGVRPMGLQSQLLSWLCGLGKALNLSRPVVEWGTGTVPPRRVWPGRSRERRVQLGPQGGRSAVPMGPAALSGRVGRGPGPLVETPFGDWPCLPRWVPALHPGTPQPAPPPSRSRRARGGLVLFGGRRGAAAEAGPRGCRDAAGLSRGSSAAAGRDSTRWQLWGSVPWGGCLLGRS